ncbi:MAG: gliding motility-associated ABC transporter ATP-binding subunit GldA [Flavobacteriaceae bacterium]|nr:gliding motility-associated ABC transporter ATP-binding subunit GldA [Flavobacteriaceae bacterium]|tara:strand:- start:42248 stop:42949 length:702 start_codon:yes stop_codon:yes gene_type:complete
MSLVTKNLNKNFKDFRVLNNISLELKKGEITGLLGINGAGKSTLIRILAGYYDDWDGQISINGLNYKKNLKEIKKITGYLPENNPLYKEMYVEEYLKFIISLYRVKVENYNEIIEKTGLSDVLKKKISILSKGFKQRIGIASSIIHNPLLLLMDEPISGLDPLQLNEIRSLIKNLSKSKIILFSSHILQEIDLVCDKIIIINKGEIILNEYKNKLKKPLSIIFNEVAKSKILI